MQLADKLFGRASRSTCTFALEDVKPTLLEKFRSKSCLLTRPKSFSLRKMLSSEHEHTCRFTHRTHRLARLRSDQPFLFLSGYHRLKTEQRFSFFSFVETTQEESKKVKKKKKKKKMKFDSCVGSVNGVLVWFGSTFVDLANAQW